MRVRVLLVLLLFVSTYSFAQTKSDDWSAVDQALGRKGSAQPGEVHKFAMPRSDSAGSRFSTCPSCSSFRWPKARARRTSRMRYLRTPSWSSPMFYLHGPTGCRATSRR